MHFTPTMFPPSQFSLLRIETENRKKKNTMFQGWWKKILKKQPLLTNDRQKLNQPLFFFLCLFLSDAYCLILKDAIFSVWSIRGFLILKMNHFFVSPGHSITFFLCFLTFLCVQIWGFATQKREKWKKKGKKKGKKEKTEVAFTNLGDNDMATRQGFYSQVGYRNCPLLNV